MLQILGLKNKGLKIMFKNKALKNESLRFRVKNKDEKISGLKNFGL